MTTLFCKYSGRFFGVVIEVEDSRSKTCNLISLCSVFAYELMTLLKYSIKYSTSMQAPQVKLVREPGVCAESSIIGDG